MGDRWSNPLDQWPDPEVYIHYPSRQQLAYMDIRNLNRTWPGRPERDADREDVLRPHPADQDRRRVDIVIDLHEAELQYPVISTIVAHQKGLDLAAMASMILTDEEFKIGDGEFAGRAARPVPSRDRRLHGRHPAPFRVARAVPRRDARAGPTPSSCSTGKDEFVVRAGKRGLLFEKIDEKGWPHRRPRRPPMLDHPGLAVWSQDHADRAVLMKNVPKYAEVVAKGVGAFLHDPAKADAKKIYYE